MISSSPESVEDVLRRFDDSSSLKNSSGDLQDSCMTSPTETGSISEDESLGWLGGITADIKTLAVTLKDTAGGVASFVQKSALAVASEIAHLEEEELAHRMASTYDHCEDSSVMLHLPWEVQCTNGQFEEDEVLKSKIRALARREDTFLQPYSVKDEMSMSASSTSSSYSASVRPPFLLDEPRIFLVRRILDLDEKLAAMHARLSGRSDVKEAVFWQNYFHNCELTREEHFVLHPLAEQTDFVEEEEEDDRTDSDDDESYIEVPSPPASQRSLGSLVVISGADLDIPN
eukprot:CAMPEP_0172448884 /NCGR_PEP_ID=MMETSP1065-20121228/7783_1 /TAXON_ID=265537 /ORGANISM="Amphiprora paludosa, Strain CCMP125" /LENGTH=287 /DNA_ID=CAMNT_0013200475 /DNA_START=300 /DNA_END=1163 /DNA_ORIENTATION=-